MKFGNHGRMPKLDWLGKWDGIVMSWDYGFPSCACLRGYGDLDDSDFDALASRLGDMMSECARIMWWHGDPPLGAEKIGGGT